MDQHSLRSVRIVSFRIQALQAVAAGAANDLGISHDFLRFREK
jgi:hypothetical protein